eukprot:gene17229-19641_t
MSPSARSMAAPMVTRCWASGLVTTSAALRRFLGTGVVNLLSGSATKPSANIDLATYTDVHKFTASVFGSQLGGAYDSGDINGDSLPDLLISETGVNSNSGVVAPTRALTRAPTVFPSQKGFGTPQETIGFTQSLRLNLDVGQSAADEAKLKLAYEAAIRNDLCIAAGLSVVNCNIQVNIAKARLANIRAQAATLTTFLATILMTRFDFSVPKEAFISFVSTRIVSEEFAAVVRTYAVLYNATSLFNCTLGAAVTFDPVEDAVRREDPMTVGEIAGLVIGSCVFVAFLCAAVWLAVRRASFTSAEESDEKEKEAEKGDENKNESVSTAAQDNKRWLTVGHMMQAV